MPKSDLQLLSGHYAPVADRITLFYQAFPTGRILTELISHDGGRMIVKAFVYRGASDGEPAATGLAAEREDDGEINAVACLENTETSAIGRALANLGFTASRQRPSAEEMARATQIRERLGGGRPKTSRGETLERRANEAMDLLDLMRAAERLGLSKRRLNVLRLRVLSGDVDRSRSIHLARTLRGWTNRRAAAAIRAASGRS